MLTTWENGVWNAWNTQKSFRYQSRWGDGLLNGFLYSEVGTLAVEKRERSGRLSSGRVHKNRQENRSTISEIADRLGLAYGIYQRIRREGLKMRRISAKFVKKHKQCLVTRNTSLAPDHPYTPNWAPYDFFLFLRMKSQLCGRRLQDMDKIRSNRWVPYTRFHNARCNGLSARAETQDPLQKLWRVLTVLNVTVAASIRGKCIFRYRARMCVETFENPVVDRRLGVLQSRTLRREEEKSPI
jgi:hypothetical protein